MLENFGQSFSRLVTTRSESEIHPHVPEERAELFKSVHSGAAEIETLTLLNALVCLFKPQAALETGTGSGYAAAAIASAMAANGFGELWTLDVDPALSQQARENVAGLDPGLEARIRFVVRDSLTAIREWEDEPLDFVFFDSLIELRHLEFAALRERGLLARGAVCVFHDTSRLRGRSYGWSPEMIDALDRCSIANQWLESELSRGLRILKLR